jgi:hypothetical protein
VLDGQPTSSAADWSSAGPEIPAVDTVESVPLEPEPETSEGAPAADGSVLAEDDGTDLTGSPQGDDLLLEPTEDGAGPAAQPDLTGAGDGELRPWAEGDVLELREDDLPKPSEATTDGDAVGPTWDLTEESSFADAELRPADAARDQPPTGRERPGDEAALLEEPLDDGAADHVAEGPVDDALVEDAVPPVEDAVPPVEDAVPPVEDAVPPVEDAVPPVEGGDPAAVDAVHGDDGAATDLRNAPDNAALADQLSARGLRLGAVDDFDFRDNPVLGYRESAPPQDIAYAVQRWDDTIAPGLATGATREDFAAYDDQHGLVGHQRLSGVWDYFLGDDAIKSGGLKPNGKLDVNGGRHRLTQAGLLGITHLPFRN